jgi:hypothetical protein
VILRILAQESPDSKLRLKRDEGLMFRELELEFAKLRGIFGNI